MKYLTLWSERPYSPYLMEIVLKATVFGLNRKLKTQIKRSGVYWQNGILNYFYPHRQLVSSVDYLAKRFLGKPDFFIEFLAKGLEKAKSLRKFSDNYDQEKFKRFSERELIAYLKKTAAKFYDLYIYATIAPLIGYRDDNPIYAKMYQIIRKKEKEKGIAFGQFLDSLIKPPKFLLSHKHELAQLNLARKAKRLKLKRIREIEIKLGKELKKIQKEFAWLSYDFCDRVEWDEKYYARLILEKVKKIRNLSQEISRIKNYNKETDLDFKRVVRILDLNKNEEKVFQLVRWMGYYKWAREFEFQKGLYKAKLAHDELAQRINFDSREIKFLFVWELDKLLKNPEKYKSIAKERFKNFLIIVDQKRGLITFSGQKAKSEFNKLSFVNDMREEEKDEIKGMTAQPGKSRGIVKIINQKSDLMKMKKGDILVSVATNPELLSAMKKASAIITDEGGITCHAAIVSRELGIPCIIGTKIATKVLKDGDRVEVDANRGIVRKLKS